eukprot:COSAG01_NODE_1652_length_9619_cov_9.589181_4_plen_81_part_00
MLREEDRDGTVVAGLLADIAQWCEQGGRHPLDRPGRGGGGEEEISSGRLGARLAIVEERLSSLKGIEETLARIDRKLHTQ